MTKATANAARMHPFKSPFTRAIKTKQEIAYSKKINKTSLLLYEKYMILFELLLSNLKLNIPLQPALLRFIFPLKINHYINLSKQKIALTID